MSRTRIDSDPGSSVCSEGRAEKQSGKISDSQSIEKLREKHESPCCTRPKVLDSVERINKQGVSRCGKPRELFPPPNLLIFRELFGTIDLSETKTRSTEPR